MTVRTLAQMEATVRQVQQQAQEIRDGWVRIDALADEMLRVNSESQTGKDAKELAQNALKR